MVNDYSLYCDSAKYYLIKYLHNVNEILHKIANKENKKKRDP